jgi:WD40 repeat protein
VKIQLSLMITMIMLSACSFENGSTFVEATGSSAATSVPATATPGTILPNTPIPATEVLPSPTPLSPMIASDTIDRLSIFTTFGQGETLRSLAFSPDGSVLASAGGNTEDFKIRLWEVKTGQLLGTLVGHSSIVWNVAFSPDGKLLASVSRDQTANIWDWESESVLKSLNISGEGVSVRVSPDGQTLVVGGVESWPDAAIWLYDIANWQLSAKLVEYWNIPALAFSPDGEYLVGGGTSRNVRVWRMDDQLELFTLYHSGQVTSLAISPDGSTIASGLCESSENSGACSRGAIWLWSLENGKELARLSDFSDWVDSVAFSADGSLLIGQSRDGALRLYTASDLQPVFMAGSPGGSGVMEISNDGRLLATTRLDGQLDLWRVQP